MTVCVFVSPPRQHISGTAYPIFAEFVCMLRNDRCSVLVWRRCDTLCTSGLYGSMLILLQRVTSLRRRALLNAPVASIGFVVSRLQTTTDAETRRVHRAGKGCRPGAERQPAMHHCLVSSSGHRASIHLAVTPADQYGLSYHTFPVSEAKRRCI